MKHELYQIKRGQPKRFLGRQCFVTSEQARDQENVQQLETQTAQRSTSITTGTKHLGAFSLMCGEINVIGGSGQDIKCRSCPIENALLNSDIIINPTHDRMSNHGILKGKRQWLSQAVNGRNRIYVSSSNWNTDKAALNSDRRFSQTAQASTLHTVYMSGCQQELTRKPDPKGFYEYRQCFVDL